MNNQLQFLSVDKDNIDIEMIYLIEKDGINYFIDRYKKFKKMYDKNSFDKEVKYYKSYLNIYFTEEIFGTYSEKYVNLINYIIDNDDISIINYIDNKKIFFDILIYNIISCKLTFNNLSKIYKILCKCTNTMEYICNSKYWNYNSNNLNFLGNLIRINILNVNNINNQIENVFNIVYIFLKNKKMRECVVNWFSDVYNLNIDKKNISDMFLTNEINDDNLFISLLVLLKTWNNGFNINKINIIDLDFINSDSCKINWEKKESNNNKQYNYLSKCFFIIHKILEISLINIYENMDLYKKDLYYLNIELKNEEHDAYEKSNIEFKIGFIKSKIESSNKFLEKYNCYLETINNFYYNSLEWLNYNVNNFVDRRYISECILNNYKIFINNNKNFTKYYDDIFCNIFRNIMTNDNLTNNPYIKKNFIGLFEDFIYYEENTNSFNHSNLHYLNDINLFHLLIKKFNYFETAFDEIFEKSDCQLQIINIINTVFYNNNEHSEFIFNFKCLCQDNNFIIKKFINIFLGNISLTAENLFKNLKELNEKELNDDISEDNNNELKHYIKNYNYEFINYMNLTSNFTNYINKTFVDQGIRDKFTSFLNFIIGELIGNSKQLKIKDPDKYTFKPILYLEYLLKILLSMCDLNTFCESFSNDTRYFNSNYILKFVRILEKNNKITPIETNIILKFQKTVDILHTEYIQNDIEIPDEFCDPIMQTIIEDPVFLPNCDIIMDRSIITRHLLSDEHNPFNRDKLTIGILDNYNKKPDIILKINDFNEKLSNWKISVKFPK